LTAYNTVRTDLIGQDDGSLVIYREQDISDDFLDTLRSERLASRNVREREYMKVASVPAAVFDLWHAQGLDPWNMDAREVVARLRKDGLEDFLATTKEV